MLEADFDQWCKEHAAGGSGWEAYIHEVGRSMPTSHQFQGLHSLYGKM